jgi:DNA-binding ferritin-like protein (Dps family)
MSRRNREEAPIGEDCFLDTIANLVGILIILVVIVGSRSYATAKVAAQEKLKNQVDKLETPVSKAKQLDSDLQKQYEELQKYEMELAFRDAERMAILDRVNMAERIAEEELKNVDETERDELENDIEMSELQKQLAELIKQQGDVQAIQPNTAILQHLPTPMAKTVFGRELHVMLRGGMVAVIPWERLVTALKSEARRSVERNSQKSRMVNQLGPIDGFLMIYGLKSQSGMFSDGRTTRVGKSIELEKFELEPTEDVVRETVEQSLATGGRLRVDLSSSPPQQTTVTVWVYPDSFEQFRVLKERLFVDGYLCAARPLPFHVRIGASPRGSASTAQ